MSNRPTALGARWYGTAFTGSGFAFTRACRDVLLGAGRPVAMTERAVRYLAKIREGATSTGHLGGNVITHDGDDVRWSPFWTTPDRSRRPPGRSALGPVSPRPPPPGLTPVPRLRSEKEPGSGLRVERQSAGCTVARSLV